MMKNLTLYTFLLFLFYTGCMRNVPEFLDYRDTRITYLGRMTPTDTSGMEIYWSGSVVKLNFKGRSVKALLKDENGDNYFNVIIDDSVMRILRPGKEKRYYTLTEGVNEGKHTLKLFKRNEWDRGTTRFYGFLLEKGTQALPPDGPKKLKMEFYGNSITAAYAVEDTSGKDSPDSTFTNCYHSYAFLTAKHFNADYHLIVKSGIGVTISWFPLIMPEMYNRTNPNDPRSRWDFSKFKPDIVVVNLFQNDSWLVNMPDNAQFKARFGRKKPDNEFLIAAYADFISALRKKHPQAKIICMLGNMDITRQGSPWPGYVRQAVARLNDPAVFTFFVPFKNTPGHPDISEQKEMAEALTAFIEDRFGWQAG